MPLVAFPALVHLGVAFASAVLVRTRRGDQRGIGHTPAAQERHGLVRLEQSVDGSPSAAAGDA